MRKTAIIYNELGYKSGADRVILALARMLQADIITASFDTKLAYSEYKAFRVYLNPLLSQKLLRILHPLYYFKNTSKAYEGIMFTEGVFKFRRMDLKDYDLIITSGEWGKHLAIKDKHHPLVHYEHTPPKVLYELAEKDLPIWLRPIYGRWARYLKQLDKEATEKIDLLLCNSQNIKKKIENFFHREAHVVYPPVNTEQFHTGKSEDFFLSVQRIDPQKRVHLQIEIFRRLSKEKLIVVGSGAEARNKLYEKKLKEKAPQNVTFVGSVEDKELVDLYGRCKGVIQTGENEDFGIVPIEAAASGKPCIASREGGFQETIIHGKTGLLIDPPYLENFIKAIISFSEKYFDASYCIERARLFSEETFQTRIKELLEPYR